MRLGMGKDTSAPPAIARPENIALELSVGAAVVVAAGAAGTR
jgi:hypothetical protein